MKLRKKLRKAISNVRWALAMVLMLFAWIFEALAALVEEDYR